MINFLLTRKKYKGSLFYAFAVRGRDNEISYWFKKDDMNFRAFEWRQVIEKIKIPPSTPVPWDDKDLVVKGLLRPSEKFWFFRRLDPPIRRALAW